MLDIVKTKLIKRTKLDLTILGLMFTLCFILSAQFDFLESIYSYSRQFEFLELDEVFSAIFLMVFFFAIFAYRRWQDTKLMSLYCEELAMLDPITQLPNQRALERLVVQMKNQADYPSSFLLIDIDGLEVSKNKLGLAATEQISIEVLYKLSQVLDCNQVLAYRNGHQYFVYCPNIDQIKATELVAKLNEINFSSRYETFNWLNINIVSTTLCRFTELSDIFECLDDELLHLRMEKESQLHTRCNDHCSV